MRSAAPWRSRGPGRHPVSHPQCQQRTGRARHSRPGRPPTLQASHPPALETQPNLQALSSRRSPISQLQGARVIGCVTRERHRIPTHAASCSPWAPSWAARFTSAWKVTPAAAPAIRPSNRLAARLRELPLRVGRLKTGTPPRIDGRSIDYAGLREQHSDDPRPVFSYLGTPRHRTRGSYPATSRPPTSAPTTSFAARPHARPCSRDSSKGSVRATARRSKTRSCASRTRCRIRFSSSPKGSTRIEVYPNGISTSLPFDVQCEFVRTIKGFERAHITRPGYAIEYDFFDPRDLKSSLESKFIGGLFFAGQINGTTGYEEAAAQGLLAGANAALAAGGRDPWRTQAQRSLYRRAGRRSHHARRARAVSHVHQPRRVSPVAARGQRGSALDRARPRARAWSATSAGNFSSASAQAVDAEVARLEHSCSYVRRMWTARSSPSSSSRCSRETHAFELLAPPGARLR